MMNKKWIGIAIGFLVLMPIFFVAFGEAVLHLWNWLMPTLFGLRTINFWQAIGLLLLSWLLFGRGLRGGHWRHHGMRRRWERMSPEERERFRQGMQHRCAPFSSVAPADPKP
jgi:hypothetical protein